MAVDFYYVDDFVRKQPVLSLDDKAFEELQTVLLKFEKLTGIKIDKYGKTRISNQHMQLITNLLESRLKERLPELSAKRLSVILKQLKNIRNDLIAIGD